MVLIVPPPDLYIIFSNLLISTCYFVSISTNLVISIDQIHLNHIVSKESLRDTETKWLSSHGTPTSPALTLEQFPHSTFTNSL